MVKEWELVYHKQAQKDAKNLLSAGLNRLLKKHQVIRGNHFCRIISEIAA